LVGEVDTRKACQVDVRSTSTKSLMNAEVTMRTGSGKRMVILCWLAFACLPQFALADWTGGTAVTVTDITHDSATFSASITTDSAGSGEYLLYFSLFKVGGSGVAVSNNPIDRIAVNGNKTTSFAVRTTSLTCGTEYDVSGTYLPAEGGTPKGVSTSARTKFSTLPCASLSPTALSYKYFTGVAITPIAFTAVNFNGTPTFQVTPALPVGLSFSASTGTIAGTPTASQIETRHLIRGTGSVSGVATATVTLTVAPGLTDLDALRYIASHPDLIDALGLSVDKARQHYRDWGFNEGRKITFQPLYYTASHPDLISAFGLDEIKAVTHFIEVGYKQKRNVTFDPDLYLASNPALIEPLGGSSEKGVKHYIEWGYKEGRKTNGFDTLGYVASYPDLISAFGLDTGKALRHYIESGYRQGRVVSFDGNRYLASNPLLIGPLGASSTSAARHYIEWGYREGRSATSFDPLAYTASYPDLIDAFGVDTTKALRHYIEWGYKEGRATTFKPLLYIASYPDLIAAFGINSDEGAKHYIQWGYKAGRRTSFSALAYAASHPDLIRAFGANENEAAKHYIQWGYREGRSTTFSDLDALQYVASFADLIQSIGSDIDAAIRHYLTIGYNAGRQTVFNALAYIASYGDLIAAFGTNAVEGAKHYVQWGYREGRRIVFDALGYLAKHADLRAAFGTDLVAATKHYINSGFNEKRAYDFSVSGNVQVTGIFQIDSDTNDPSAPQTRNAQPSEAQNLVAPFALIGHVNRAKQGDPRGKWYESGDLDDVFKVTLRKGQAAILNVAAENLSSGDIGLELYDSKVTLVSGIQSYARVHRVTAPADGDYFIAVRARAGASRYTLEVASFVPAAAASLSESSFSDPDFVSGELIVSFKDKRIISNREYDVSSSFPRLEDNVLSAAYTIKDDLGQNLYTAALKLTPNEKSDETGFGTIASVGEVLIPGGRFRDSGQESKYLTMLAAREIARDQSVNHVSLNYLAKTSALPNDPGYGNQRWHYEAIKLPAAWDITTGSADVVVAVIDSGVIRHPDLIDNLLQGYDFVESDPKGDGDGEDADASDPGNIPSQSNLFRRSHGTHVAGTIAARGNNGIGVTGVSYKTKILPLRVFSAEGGASDAVIIKAMKYAAGLLAQKPSQTASIVNMSLGGETPFCSAGWQEAVNQVRAAGVIVVAANGNERTDFLDQFGIDFVQQPANCVGVVSVAATEPSGQTTFYSNQGPETDIAAPGGANFGDPSMDIYSTDMARVGGGATSADYRAIAGTSMATPHVAGVISLMKAVKPSLTPSEFDGLLASGRLTIDLTDCPGHRRSDGSPLKNTGCTPGKDVASGYGLIDAFKALNAVAPTAAKPPPRIDVTPGSIDFGVGVSQADLYVTLLGEGPVNVARSTSGEPWLTLSPGTLIDSNTLRYTVTINRGAASNGAFSGMLTFKASTSTSVLNTVNVPVYFSKPSVTSLGNAGTQYALVVNPNTNKSAGQSSPFQAKESSSAYSITGVVEGSYYVVAGTDVDNNYFICEEGEICSIYEVTKGNSNQVVVKGPVSRVALKAQIIRGLSTQASSSGNSVTTSEKVKLGVPRIGAVSSDAVLRLPQFDGSNPRTGSDEPIVLGVP
jgi:serine protease